MHRLSPVIFLYATMSENGGFYRQYDYFILTRAGEGESSRQLAIPSQNGRGQFLSVCCSPPPALILREQGPTNRRVTGQNWARPQTICICAITIRCRLWGPTPSISSRPFRLALNRVVRWVKLRLDVYCYLRAYERSRQQAISLASRSVVTP